MVGKQWLLPLNIFIQSFFTDSVLHKWKLYVINASLQGFISLHFEKFRMQQILLHY
jgi:hypothetical protein